MVLISSAAALALGLTMAFLAVPSKATGQSEVDAAPQAVSDVVDSRNKYPTEVVELFTSQGCSSCPPADRFIASLSDSPSTIALSFNVTYWDYLGWKDKFGQREFTKRQKHYARYINVGNLYTPQIVLNGEQHSSRFTREDIKQASLPETRPLIDVAADDESLKIVADSKVDLADYDLSLIHI